MGEMFNTFMITLLASIPLIFLSCIVGCMMGAFSGWVIGWTPLKDFVLGFLLSVNIHTNMVDLGACAGFVGGFLRTKVT